MDYTLWLIGVSVACGAAALGASLFVAFIYYAAISAMSHYMKRLGGVHDVWKTTRLWVKAGRPTWDGSEWKAQDAVAVILPKQTKESTND